MLDLIIAITPTASPRFNTTVGTSLGTGIRFMCPPRHDLVTVSTVPIDGTVHGAGRYAFPHSDGDVPPETFWVNYPTSNGPVDTVCVNRDLVANDPDFIRPADVDAVVAKLWTRLFDMALDAWRQWPIVDRPVPRWDKVKFDIGPSAAGFTIGRMTWPDPYATPDDMADDFPHTRVVSGSIGHLFSILLDALAAVAADPTRGDKSVA